MEKDVVEFICSNCKWYEKVVVKLFKKSFIKAYKNGVKIGFKWANY